ncbi:unnamed protein product [Prunus brigantina]
MNLQREIDQPAKFKQKEYGQTRPIILNKSRLQKLKRNEGVFVYSETPAGDP